MKKERTAYDKSFKLMAVELAASRGSIPAIAKELGITKRNRTLKTRTERNSTGKRHLKKGCRHLLQERWQIIQFIRDNSPIFAIEKMCKVLGISRSGYYEWL